MDKYKNMVDQNRKRSQVKVEKAITAIHNMLRDDEQVVVCTLVKRTGLSRTFFYNNQVVHEELIRAQELQEGKSFVAPQKVIINKAMDKEIELLKKKLIEKDVIIASQKKELSRLNKALSNQTLKTLKEL